MLTTYMTDDISSEDAAVISGEQLINPMNGSNLLTHNKFKTATTGFYDLSESAFKINGDYYVCHTFKQSAVIGNIYLDLKLCANTDVGAVYIQAHASTPSSLTFNSAMAYYVDPGTGNPNNKWSKFQANDFEIGVRATNRYTETALVSVEGNTYTVMNGARATDGSSRWGYWVSIRLLKGTFATKEIIVTITGPKGTLAMSMYNYLLAAGATPSAMSYINDSSFFSAPALASALQYATSDVGFYTVHVKVYDNLPNAAIKGKVIAGAAANFDIIQSS